MGPQADAKAAAKQVNAVKEAGSPPKGSSLALKTCKVDDL